MRYEKPDLPTEAEVQAEFYRRCRNEGLEIHLEYKGDARCRFDCVIVRGGSVVILVEVKKRPSDSPLPQDKRYDRQQQLKYLAFGVPLVYVHGMGDIERAYAEVRRIILARSGDGWKREKPSHSGVPVGTRSVILK